MLSLLVREKAFYRFHRITSNTFDVNVAESEHSIVDEDIKVTIYIYICDSLCSTIFTDFCKQPVGTIIK